MTKQVIWNKCVVEEFINLACLSDEEEMILRTRASGWTVSKQAYEFNMSESKVHKIIARLKRKYDDVQRYSMILKPRKASAKETFMDEN